MMPSEAMRQTKGTTEKTGPIGLEPTSRAAIHVVQCCLTGANGGLELAALRWAREFKQRGFGSSMVVRTSSPLEKYCTQEEINCQSIDGKAQYFRPKASYCIRQYLKKVKPQSIFVHNLRELWMLAPALIGLKPRPKVLGFAHMFLSAVDKKDPLHRWLYSNVDLLIAMTEAQIEGLKKCLPVEESRYQLIPNWVDLSQFYPSKKARDGENPLVVGFVGRFDPRKGIFEFLEAARLLRDKGLRFVMVGDDTINEQSFKTQAEQFIKDHHLREIVELRPFSENVNEQFRRFDIFAMPSYEESFGLVLIEAMASGLACISTNAGGPPEILDYGRAGLLIDPRSAEALKAAILQLVDDEQKRIEFSQVALERAQTVYSKDRVFEKVLQLLA